MRDREEERSEASVSLYRASASRVQHVHEIAAHRDAHRELATRREYLEEKQAIPPDEEHRDRVAPRVDCVKSARPRVVHERALRGEVVDDGSRLDAALAPGAVGAGESEARGSLVVDVYLVAARGIRLDEHAVAVAVLS